MRGNEVEMWLERGGHSRTSIVDRDTESTNMDEGRASETGPTSSS